MKKYERPEILFIHVDGEGLLGTISQGTGNTPIAPPGAEAGAKENDGTPWEEYEEL
ncbi:hypothetical protein [Prevotella sp. OH937_COT-195]|uniref:hypothetical protein n=1 Tax=Prevotella sp. OH937_COT-195 TaxID=2491051 RepID=UPI0013157772|nr:hypothetical protein [Prevotella sp. OH937_COT-195]